MRQNVAIQFPDGSIPLESRCVITGTTSMSCHWPSVFSGHSGNHVGPDPERLIYLEKWKIHFRYEIDKKGRCVRSTRDRSITHSWQLASMSFDVIFHLTAGFFSWYFVLLFQEHIVYTICLRTRKSPTRVLAYKEQSRRIWNAIRVVQTIVYAHSFSTKKYSIH